MLEEKANRLENDVTDLRLHLGALQSAFRNQEVELTHLSGDNMKAKKGCVDIPMFKKMV